MADDDAQASVEIYKKLRQVRKKIRQIDDLLAVKASGGELNAEQEAKILTKPNLLKDQEKLAAEMEEIQPLQPKSQNEADPPAAEPTESPFQMPEKAKPPPKKETTDSWGGAESLEGWQVAGQSTPKKEAAPTTSKKANTPTPEKPVPQASVQVEQHKQSLETAHQEQSRHDAPVEMPQQQKQQVQEKAEEQQKPQQPVKKQQEEPKYRKGWRGGAFTSRRFEQGHRNAVTCIFVVGNSRVISGGLDNAVKEWRVSDGSLIRSLGGHTKAVTAVWGDSEHTVSCSDDGCVKYWRHSDGKVLRNLYCFAPIKCMSIEGDTIATGHSDNTVRTYEAGPSGSDMPRVTLKGHQGAITMVALDNGGQNIVSTARDSSVRVWDLAKREALYVCSDPDDLEEGIDPFAAMWFPEHGRIMSTHDDGTCRMWNFSFTKATRRIQPSTDDDEPPLMYCDEARGVLALTAGSPGVGTIRVFDFITLTHLYTLVPPGMSLQASMHVTADHVACGCFSGAVVLLNAVDERKKDQLQLPLVPLLSQAQSPSKPKAAQQPQEESSKDKKQAQGKDSAASSVRSRQKGGSEVANNTGVKSTSKDKDDVTKSKAKGKDKQKSSDALKVSDQKFRAGVLAGVVLGLAFVVAVVLLLMSDTLTVKR